MKAFSIQSHFGHITLYEENDKIVALKWGKHENSKITPLFLEAKKQLRAYFSKKLKNFELPIKPEGTKFRRFVWKELLKIPYGSIKTYGSIAKIIKSGPRAVGGACRNNPLPIIIPCHRIIGNNRNLVGYLGSLDIENKKKLLELEGISISRL